MPIPNRCFVPVSIGQNTQQRGLVISTMLGAGWLGSLPGTTTNTGPVRSGTWSQHNDMLVWIPRSFQSAFNSTSKQDEILLPPDRRRTVTGSLWFRFGLKLRDRKSLV